MNNKEARQCLYNRKADRFMKRVEKQERDSKLINTLINESGKEEMTMMDLFKLSNGTVNLYEVNGYRLTEEQFKRAFETEDWDIFGECFFGLDYYLEHEEQKTVKKMLNHMFKDKCLENEFLIINDYTFSSEKQMELFMFDLLKIVNLPGVQLEVGEETLTGDELITWYNDTRSKVIEWLVNKFNNYEFVCKYLNCVNVDIVEIKVGGENYEN